MDHSALVRLQIWEDAQALIQANTWFGTGFNTYPYMKRVGQYQDPHNFYVETLVETGVVGLVLFLAVLARSYFNGWRLFRSAGDPLFAGLGLGLAGWVLCAAGSIAFGDRWTYLQIQGVLWVLCGLAAKCLKLDEAGYEEGGDEAEAEREAEQPAAVS